MGRIGRQKYPKRRNAASLDLIVSGEKERKHPSKQVPFFSTLLQLIILIGTQPDLNSMHLRIEASHNSLEKEFQPQ